MDRNASGNRQRRSPGEEFEIKFVDADRGSVKLRAAFDWLKAQLDRIHKSEGRYPRLRALAVSLAIFSAGASWDIFYDSLSTEEQIVVAELSEANRDLLKRVLEASAKPSVEAPKRRFFRQLERDETISGVGVADENDQAPITLVPSSDFHALGQRWAVLPETLERQVEQVLDVTLLAPQLQAKPLSWRFKQEGLPPFYAVMRDEDFLAALGSSYVEEQLRVSIGMTIRVSTTEVFEEGGWKVTRGGRMVTEVIVPKIDRKPSLVTSPPEEKK